MTEFPAISWQLEATRYRLESGSAGDASASLEVTRNMDEPMGLVSPERGKVRSLIGPSAGQGTGGPNESEERPLPPAFVHHLVCIGQEAVSNALRHASLKGVQIHLN